MLLQAANVDCTALEIVSTAAEGARLLATRQHDLYFVDFRLPGENGLTLVRDARQAGLTAPIIVLTGFDNPALDLAAQEAGATDYLPKGEFSAQVLGRTIRFATRNAALVTSAHEAELRLRMAQDVAAIGTWDWDIRSNTKYWSPTMFKLYGLPPDTSGPVGYDTWRSRLHPDDRERVEAVLAGALASGRTSYDITFRVLTDDCIVDSHNDGRTTDSHNDPAGPSVRWLAAKAEVIRDPNGAPIRMIGINMDVTAQQQASARLRASERAAVAGLAQSEQRFQAYFENSAEFLSYVSHGANGEFRYEAFNPAALERVGKTLAEIKGRTPVEALGPDVGGAIMAAIRHVLETDAPHHTERTHVFGGEEVVLSVVYTPLRNQAGETIGVLASGRDVTAKVQLEAALHQAQKMEALGQLAGGVAHDFNNLLTGILGSFEILGRNQTGERERRLIVEGKRAVERGKALTARLLAFSRHQSATCKIVDINDSLDEILEMLSRTLGAEVRLGKDFAPDLWLASTDTNQIDLAIINLAINARDAMPLGGELTLSTANRTISDPDGHLAPGEYVTITVTDSGTGMTPQVLARVTEPFFTTKPEGQGTGLGLSMVATTMNKLGGEMRIASEPDKGTRVTLYLPRATAQELTQEPTKTPRQQPVTRPARLLLLDDDFDTRAAISAYASVAGHDLVVADNARKVLEALDEGRPFDILIADMTLPGMPFAELVSQATSRRSNLPVLAMSGKIDGNRSGGQLVLAKPFGQDDFDHALADMLANAAPAGALIQPGRITSGRQ